MEGPTVNRNDLIDRCKRLIAEAYSEATEMIVAYLETHPDEERKPLCREIDPENFHALDKRVSRRQEKRRSEGVSGVPSSGATPNQRASVRSAKSSIRRQPELVGELLKDPDVREAVEKAIASDDSSTRRVNQAAAKRHTAPERLPRSETDIDFDQRFQDAVAEVVYRLADRAAGRWTPNERSEAALHFLRRAIDDPAAIDTNQLMEDISAYLEEATT